MMHCIPSRFLFKNEAIGYMPAALHKPTIIIINTLQSDECAIVLMGA